MGRAAGYDWDAGDVFADKVASLFAETWGGATCLAPDAQGELLVKSRLLD